jgi:hypothetical protein
VTKFPSVGLTFVPTQWTFDTLHEPVEALQA